MKAIVYEQFGSAQMLKQKEVQTPEPKENEVQIHLKYAGVNPVDWKIREGQLKDMIPAPLPIIPGWEGAGVISKLGKNAHRCKIGEEVFGYFRHLPSGTYAEYICVPEEEAVPKPKKITLQQAAGLPLVSLTAWQALFDTAKTKASEKILILGGAGGVGSMAIQFAAWKRCDVIATCRATNQSYVLSLGAKHAIDYTKEDCNQALAKLGIDKVDIVCDCVGEPFTSQSFACLKKGGRFVSIVESRVERIAPRDIQAYWVFVSPNRQQLQEISSLLDHGTIKPLPITEFTLENAKKAQDLSQQGHVRGKIVLKI
jgi:NADPH:quinone reductase-like Zn-dependent oxidoreductase